MVQDWGVTTRGFIREQRCIHPYLPDHSSRSVSLAACCWLIKVSFEYMTLTLHLVWECGSVYTRLLHFPLQDTLINTNYWQHLVLQSVPVQNLSLFIHKTMAYLSTVNGSIGYTNFDILIWNANVIFLGKSKSKLTNSCGNIIHTKKNRIE